MKIHRFKPQRKRNSLFLKVLIVVGLCLSTLLVGLAGVLVTQAIIPQEQKFDAAPKQVQNKEPEIQKRKVITKNLQKRSNQMVRRINVAKVQNVQSPEVQITLPSGMGGDSTGGFDVAGLGSMSLDKVKIDLPSLELFGIKAQSDKVLIVFDAAPRTMNDDMGGLDAYNVVKSEIQTLVRGLPSTVLFNVIAFDSHASRAAFRSSLVSASAANKEAFLKWIAPINASVSNIGIGEIQNKELNYKVPPRLSCQDDLGGLGYNGDWYQGLVVYPLYDAYQCAIEQGASVVYFLTAEWCLPKDYLLKPSKSEADGYKKAVAKKKEAFLKKGGTFVPPSEHEKFMAAAEAAGKRFVEAENAKRAASGKPLWVDFGYYFQVAIRQRLPEGVDLESKKLESDLRADWNFKSYTPQTLFANYEAILKKRYDENNLKRPTLNMILMLPKKGEAALKKEHIAAARQWSKINGGGMVRILRGAKPVSEFK